MSTGWRKGFADVVAAIRGTLADAVNAGSMSAADFLKLAGLPVSAVPTARTIGTTAPLTGGGDLSANRTLAISAASGAAAGSMSASDFSKLAGLPASAVPTTRTIGTTAPLTGGGDLSADRTLAISPASGAAAGSMAAADFSKLAPIPSAMTAIGMWQTPTVDFLSAGTVTAFTMPTVSGQNFWSLGWLVLVIDARTGGVPTTALTYDIQQNGASILSSTTPAPQSIAAATIAGTVQPYTRFAAVGISNPDMTSFPLQFKLVGAPTGPTTLTGRVFLPGFYA